MKINILFLALFIVICKCKDFPQDVPQCKAGDVKCLANVITSILHTEFKGHNGLHLVATDPLRINSMELPKNPSSPVSVELKFNDVILSGISEIRIKEVRGFDVDPRKSIFEIDANIPELTLAGPYNIDGRVLILPIVGSGKSIIRLNDLDISIKFKTRVVEKSGKEYLEVQKTKVNLIPKNIYFFLENLFNGDKTLGDNMNKFLNENSHDIFNELKPSVVEAVGAIITSVASGPFSKYPYSDVFSK